MTLAASMHALAKQPEQQRERVPILGMQIDRIDRECVSQRIDGFVRDGRAHQILTVNLDFLAIGARDERFRRVINGADLVVPDGVPVLWAARGAIHFELGPLASQGGMGKPSLTTFALGPGEARSGLTISL